MTGHAPEGLTMSTEPDFQAEADALAAELASYTPDELQGMLQVNPGIARDSWVSYQHWTDPTTRQPAIFAYDGIVFLKLAPETLSEADLRYANDHLMIGSYLYGMLRPLDLINPYRLEGKVTLPGTEFKTMGAYWKPRLTDWFIERVKADDGILVNLASAEFKDILDWKRVQRELTVLTPDFKVMKNGQPKSVTVYAKMCRGAMTRWILQNRVADPAELDSFEYEGFRSVGNLKFVCPE